MGALSDQALTEVAFEVIDFPREDWDQYQKRVHRAVGALHQRGVAVPDHEIDRVVMKSRYLMEAPLQAQGDHGRVSYFRRRLKESLLVQEQPGGDTAEMSRRVDILLELSSVRNTTGRSAPDEFTADLEAAVRMSGRDPHGGGLGDLPPGLGGGGVGSGLTSASPTENHRQGIPGQNRSVVGRLPPAHPDLAPNGFVDDGDDDGGASVAQSQRSQRERYFDRQAESLEKMASAVIKLVDQRGPGPKEDKDERTGVIRVNPVIRWPTLGDRDNDVDNFLEEFTSMTGLANDGRGMKVSEMLLTLGSCLEGSKKLVYQHLMRVARRLGRVKTSPQEVFDEVVARLSEFKESLLERQRRVQGEFEDLTKRNLSALNFLPLFERACDELDQANLHKGDVELLLAYFLKVGDIGPASRS